MTVLRTSLTPQLAEGRGPFGAKRRYAPSYGHYVAKYGQQQPHSLTKSSQHHLQTPFIYHFKLL